MPSLCQVLLLVWPPGQFHAVGHKFSYQLHQSVVVPHLLSDLLEPFCGHKFCVALALEGIAEVMIRPVFHRFSLACTAAAGFSTYTQARIQSPWAQSAQLCDLPLDPRDALLEAFRTHYLIA